MRIHEQNRILKEKVQTLLDGMNEIKRYLNSSKFDTDTNVNRNDILNRINENLARFNELPDID